MYSIRYFSMLVKIYLFRFLSNYGLKYHWIFRGIICQTSMPVCTVHMLNMRVIIEYSKNSLDQSVKKEEDIWKVENVDIRSCSYHHVDLSSYRWEWYLLDGVPRYIVKCKVSQMRETELAKMNKVSDYVRAQSIYKNQMDSNKDKSSHRGWGSSGGF